MIPVPLIPDSAPFTPAQRAWLNGFFAGLFSRMPAAATAPAASPALSPLTILFGSQTGTAEGLAKRIVKEAGKHGFAATAMDMAEMTVAKLAAEQNVLIITSTYGDGEPPDNAKTLWEALAADNVPDLSRVRYSVLALGDSNYTQFCQCGKDFDARLAKGGAARVAPRVDCDVEFDADFERWLNAALQALASPQAADEPQARPSAIAVKTADSVSATASPAQAGIGTRRNPYPARLIESRNLNGNGSSKETRHVVIALEDPALYYQPGDALGVFPQNCPAAVEELLQALHFDGEEAVPAPSGDETTLRRALLLHYDLARPSKDFLAALAAGVPAGRTGSDIRGELSRLLAPGSAKELSAYLYGREIIDFLAAGHEMDFSPAGFVSLLKPLQPRLYSIASSLRATPGEVHLTVGAVRFETHGRARKGVCSTFLADRVKAGETLSIFFHHNANFRLPAAPETPIIMVGPGTGIAPFRAFLHERAAAGTTGKSWLFFGDQHAATDFLYREELEELHEKGALSRLDSAFSRDQAEKIYVQQRMLENARELFDWLDNGAHFYVCGDASRMAKDVDAALHRVVEIGGGRSAEQAVEYVKELRAGKRYQRDVY